MTAAMFERKLNRGSAPAGDRFRLLPFGEIMAHREGHYVVKGLIPQGLTIAWGPPKSGKSFWCSDLALHVALGWEYRGHRVQQGAVVYVAAEGAFGFGARVEAFRQAKLAEDHAPPPFYLMGERLDLIGDHVALVERIRAQLGDVQPVAVFIDTLNRTLAGSESSDEDMTAYVGAADAIREAFGCAVVIVHHCGVDGTRPRGHTSLTGACDAQLAVKRDGTDGTFTVTIEHMKDGPEGEVIACRLESVSVGTDTDGDEITSCVVVEAEAGATTRSARLTPKQRRALDALNNLIADGGQAAPDETHYPAGARVVPVETWRAYLDSAGVLNPGNPRQAWQRIHDGLANRGATAEWAGLVWAVQP